MNALAGAEAQLHKKLILKAKYIVASALAHAYTLLMRRARRR
jgi:hypothetical protein